jgi:ABC-type transport system involved in cytochrome c biogenesis permease subunit
MFTTNNHIYIYIAGGIFLVSSFLFLLKKKTASFLVLMAGLALYTLYLAGRGWITGTFIPNNMFDAPFFFTWCFGLLILLHRIFARDDRWGVLLVPLLLFTLVAIWHVKGIIPPTPNKQTLWAPSFFITETFAHACFYSGAAFAAVNLIGNNIDETFHAYVVWGFVLYCIAQVTGAVWCYYGWGNTFQWVPKHMGSTAIWLVYAAYIHLRFIAGWSNAKRSWYALAVAIISLVINASYYIKELSFPRIGG